MMINEVFIDGEGMVGIGVVEPVLVNKLVDPAKETQTFLPPDGVDGFNRIVVLPIPERYVDTSDTTATASDILQGETAFVWGEKITGTMQKRGNFSDIIVRKNEVISIPEGYHNGNGTVKIVQSEQDKIIPENIKAGVSILGVNGGIQFTSIEISPAFIEQVITPPTGYDGFDEITVQPINNQSKSATPAKQSQTITPDSGYDGLDQVIINSIPNKFFDINDYAMSESFIDLSLETATEVKPYCFQYARKIKSISGPELISIGNYAFRECQNLRGTTGNNLKLTNIGNYAFHNCEDITTFTARNLERVGVGAFKGCSSLTIFSNFKTLTSIGESAFNGCSSLIIAGGELELVSPTVYGNAFNGVQNIDTINFSGGPDLQDYAFNGTPNLETVIFQQNATSISSLAFSGCPALTDIYVPWSSTDSINANAPWGATDVVIIHYNTQYDQDGYPIA